MAGSIEGQPVQALSPRRGPWPAGHLRELPVGVRVRCRGAEEGCTGLDGPAAAPRASPPLPYVQELIAGGLAGALAKSCVAPLERCKILFQVEAELGLEGGARQHRGALLALSVQGTPCVSRALWLRPFPPAFVDGEAAERQRAFHAAQHLPDRRSQGAFQVRRRRPCGLDAQPSARLGAQRRLCRWPAARLGWQPTRLC